ncbi:MAG: hypothetical protein WCY88_06710 [Spongiibacteraceae bacterium]
MDYTAQQQAREKALEYKICVTIRLGRVHRQNATQATFYAEDELKTIHSTTIKTTGQNQFSANQCKTQQHASNTLRH